MKKTTILVMIVSILAKIFGFVRDKVVFHFFGAGVVSDAFTLSYGIPSLLLTVIASALVTGFIPMYTKVRNEDQEKANDFTNNVFNIFVLFAFVAGIIMFLIPEVIVKLAAVKFPPETHLLASNFVRTISFSVISVAIVQLGTGYLNVNKSFILPSVMTVPSNIIVIVFVILAHKYDNTQLMAVGTLIGFTVQGVLMFIYMNMFGFRYKLTLNHNDPYLREMVRLATPLLLSTIIVTLNNFAISSFATVIHSVGAYSYITMSNRLLGFATGIFVTGVLSVAYPTVAAAAAKDDKAAVIHSMNDAILLISLFILPAMVGFITMRFEIVSFVYGGGEMTVENLSILSNVFLGSVVGIFFFGVRDLFTRILYAYHDMKTPLINQIIYVVINVILFVVLGYQFGLIGITIAGSIAALASTMFLFNSLLKRFKRLGMRTILKDLVKIIVSSLLMGVAVYGLKYVFAARMGSRLMTLVVIAIAGIVYVISILALRLDLVRSLLKKRTA